MNENVLVAPMQATIVQVLAPAGAVVAEGAPLLILEAMKMEHELSAPCALHVQEVFVVEADVVDEGAVLLRFEPACGEGIAVLAAVKAAGPTLRANLQELHDRVALTLDAARPDAMEKRHRQGMRTARENIADLCDAQSFVEYGALAFAAQKRRRPMDDLIRQTPADGMVTGIGSVNAALFGAERARCAVMAYDFTVLAGTQGMRNHEKTDRLLGIASAQRLPVVLFAEGGGGRPGDTDSAHVAGLCVPTFASFARLSGRVPVIGIVAGRCFAGNAALLGCSDVIIAARNANIGMGGPAMIEGGGLGVHRPEDIGPASVQHANGVIDVLVDDEAAAVHVAKKYLGYFQGCLPDWGCGDVASLRDALPDSRVRSYDMRHVMALLVDSDSLLELRAGFGVGIITALARIEGRPLGIIANNPVHLGGAIDTDAADKAARFMQLCDVHGLPMVSLVDTPGFMVGPEIETRAQVRHVSRMFVAGANLRVPLFAIVLRKGYGLGAMAMTGGGFHATVATAAWPSGEFGGMGLEGAVRLGYRRELEAACEGAERDALFERLLGEMIANGRAVNVAAHLEIDAVIDPADTRHWLMRGFESARVRPMTNTRFIDSW